ncbi:MAG: sigma-70 family RNA polymerase sigma factor [Acidobacteriota bacterium]
MGEPKDADLMAATRAGDLDAFGVIVDRYKDGLVNYLTRLSGCRQRAEDLAQEGFLRLLETAERYQDRGCLKALLYRIAVNRLRSENRRRRRWRIMEPLLGPGHDGTGAPPTQPRDDLLRTEAQRRLAEAIAELPLRFRVPLVLHEIEGWSYGDIATSTDSRIGTVKSRIARARGRLKESLAPYWNGESDARQQGAQQPGTRTAESFATQVAGTLPKGRER